MSAPYTGERDMTANPMRKFLDILRGTASQRAGKEHSDGQLLTRFVKDRDDRALETLVHRHAPMVWSVCRRNLTRHDDAEDAFQATFLVFLRKAASIRARELLANWLYGVAYQTSRKLRQTAAKRPVPLPTPEPPMAAPDDAFGPELLSQLDRELSRLPEKYRSAIVLCHLQGKSLRDAAAQMRVAEGTVGSRLARGRQMLAQRMSRHGASVSAGALAAVCSQQAASAALPEALLTRTIEAVRLMGAGQAVTAGLLNPDVSPLAQGVLRAMASAKLRVVGVVLLLLGLAIGGGIVASQMIPGPPATPDQRAEKPSTPIRPEKKNPDEPNPDKDGTAAGARNSARNLLQDHLFTLTVVKGRFTFEGIFGYWPSRDIEATFDPATHEWILSGACRHDFQPGLPIFGRKDGILVNMGQTKELDFREREWKLVLAYNGSARAYQVRKKDDLPGNNALAWPSTSKSDFARWLLSEYPEPKLNSEPITALHLAVAVPEPKKFALKPNYTYGKKELAVAATPRGVSVRIAHGVGGPVEQWNLQFGGPDKQFLKVAKYGGAYGPDLLPGSPGPRIEVKHCVLDGGKQASEWSCNPGEFVVREIEVKEQKVVRLAIDFIADTAYGWPAAAKRDSRQVIRGSLRFNSLLQPSLPNLAADAENYRLTDPAPAGLRGMKFVPLPKGTLYMGWNGTKGSAKKREIKEDFEIAVYTVTQGQWQELMWNSPSWFSRQGGGKEAVKDIKDEELKKFPVESVSWNDVQAFIKRLNEREKGKGYVYRLPTQAEWEYACRGGATTEEECSYHFYFEKPTNDLSSKQANFNGNQPFGKGEKGPYLERTTKVGSYAPNKLGLYDMHGNVWQWTFPGGLRGGGWHNSAGSCRAASSAGSAPGSGFPSDARFESLGFRLVRVPVR
jgi:RNA polymerase sigma factor (sigma-70 family)